MLTNKGRECARHTTEVEHIRTVRAMRSLSLMGAGSGTGEVVAEHASPVCRDLEKRVCVPGRIPFRLPALSRRAFPSEHRCRMREEVSMWKWIPLSAVMLRLRSEHSKASPGRHAASQKPASTDLF
jgi:hypothetical protein